MAAAEPRSATVDLPLRGMSCAARAVRIEQGLGALAGVRQASVNFAAERAHVTFAPAALDAGRLVARVTELGYEVPLTHLPFPIGGMSCASCVGRVEAALRGVLAWSTPR